MTVNKLPAHASNYTACTGRTIRYIVVHYTGNKGDTAWGNCNYFASANRNVSAHYFVDDDSIWQSVDDKNRAWHCGHDVGGRYYHDTCRNANSIGVEICMLDKSGNVRPEAVAKAAELVRWLMQRYNIPLSNVMRHYDVTHKSCPAPMVTSSVMWEAFKKSLEEPELTEKQVRAIAREETKNYLASLEKLPASDWAAQELAKAKANGITDGTAPQAYATREQVAVMIQRTK